MIRFTIKHILLLAFLLVQSHLFSQILISSGGTQTICSGTFFDSGNNTAGYQNNENFTISFCDISPTGCITIDFTILDLETNFDVINVYDGPTTGSPLINTLTGSTPITISSISSNCITLTFTSDGSVTQTGWEATISCGVCPTCTDGIQNGNETGIDCGGSCPTVCTVPTVQDCLGSIPICQNTYTETNAYSGTGTFPNEINSSNSCLGSGEKNDVWYSFTAQTSGNMCFSITPNVLSDDYDWAVYNLSNATCSDIFNNAALEVSCNYSGASGVTGPNGLTGSQNNSCLTVTAGETYVLNVSQFTSSSNGYNIDFSASTAVIFDITGPAFDSVQAGCTGELLTLYFTENVNCTIIKNNLSGFQILDASNNIMPITLDSVISAMCNIGGLSDNAFTFYLTPSLPVGNYTFLFGDSPSLITDLCSNIANAADLTTTFTYDTLSFSNTDTLFCFPTSANTGSYTLGVLGGSPPYTYFIDGAQNNSSLFSNLSLPGQYTFSVTDNNNCSLSQPVIYFQQADSLIFTAAEISCYGESITLHISSLVSCNSINNNLNSFQILDNSNVPVISIIDSATSINCSAGLLADSVFTFYLSPPLNSGNYSIYFTGHPDSLSSSLCGNNTDPLNLQASMALDILQITYADTSFCFDYEDTLSSYTLNYNGGLGPYTFLNNGIANDSAFFDSLIVPGNYLLEVVDSKGCRDTLSSIHFNIRDSLTISADTTIMAETEAFLYGYSNNGASFQWTPSDLVNCPDCDTTSAFPLNTTTFSIEITDSNNCVISGEVIVTVTIPPVFIPNGFSPNGDMLNDILYVRALGVSSFQIQIFDKWGNLVFESLDVKNGWDGTYKGKKVNTGVFVYRVDMQLDDGTNFSEKGNITLFR